MLEQVSRLLKTELGVQSIGKICPEGPYVCSRMCGAVICCNLKILGYNNGSWGSKKPWQVTTNNILVGCWFMPVRNTHLPIQTQRLDSETWRTAEARLLMTVLQDLVFDRRSHRGQLQHLFPSMQVHPPVPHWLSTVGLQSSWTLPKVLLSPL